MASSVAVCDSMQNSQLVNSSINFVLNLLYSFVGRLKKQIKSIMLMSIVMYVAFLK
jgi:hypothetical protein